MTRSRIGLARLFPAAALIAAMGLPLTACAQAQAVEPEAQAPEAQQAAEAPSVEQAEEAQAEKDTKPMAEKQADATEQAAESKEQEKTPEELAAENDKKELERLQREASLRAARLKAELAPLQEQKQRIEAELALLSTKQQDAQAKSKLEKEQADFAAQLQLAELSREMQQMQQQFQQMQVKTQIEALKRQQETAELSAQNAKLSALAASLQAELALIQTRRNAASVAKNEMKYPDKPLDGKTLHISDRRIPLNGPIRTGTADYVTQRIHYFNNLNEKAPIFIVIDNSPGGSVMEGYRIVTAMQNSKAPVHVMVKSYAASMAAVITTLAEESYAYPNAVLLHHQMSSGMRGNLTQQKEWLEEGFEWAKRLANPVAEKMGVTYDEFTELMYKNNSDGDWSEFADNAVKLKWVNHVVEEIRETALVTAPTSNRFAPAIFFQSELPQQQADQYQGNTLPRALTQEELFHSPVTYKTKIDGNGNTYKELPPLQPFDYYFMYDPDQRYRIAK